MRPKSNYKIPQLIQDLINQCWDADPSKRPKAEVLQKTFLVLYNNWKEDLEINKQIKKANEINEKLSSNSSPLLSTVALSYTTHSQAVYTSRLLDFKNLPEPKNANDNDNLLGKEYSGSYNLL